MREDVEPTLELLVRRLQAITPDRLPAVVAEVAQGVGAMDATVWLTDYEQRRLVAVRHPTNGATQPIDSTIAGRCFRTLRTQHTADEAAGRRVWVPLVDGTERLGVLELVLRPDTVVETLSLDAFATCVAELIMTKRAYGDAFEVARRSRPMSLAAELLWRLLPPLTFGCEGAVIAAAVEPVYDVGGDAFDYAADDRQASFAIFDAMGHGLGAGLLSTVAIAAYRNARRAELDLQATVARIDAAVAEHMGDMSYVTAVLGQLDLRSGRVRLCIAGHPRPLLVRRHRLVKALDGGADLPLGLGSRPGILEASLEPGDRLLLYTDGIIEARSPDGELFGLERFVDTIARTAMERMPPQETMRRLMHAITDHHHGTLHDDATALMVQWPSDPPTMLPR